MDPGTKINLSDKELSMVTDASLILTKHAIIEKVYDLFASCLTPIKSNVLEKVGGLPTEVSHSIPKISKGENYLGLPYVILDYPRCFYLQNTFALRTMFWWGNFFSVTLHLSGTYKTLLQETILQNHSLLANGFFVGIGEDQWAHHFEKDNYVPYTQFDGETFMQLIRQQEVLKLALKFNLWRWNEMPVLLEEGYIKIAGLLTSSLTGERVL